MNGGCTGGSVGAALGSAGIAVDRNVHCRMQNLGLIILLEMC